MERYFLRAKNLKIEGKLQIAEHKNEQDERKDFIFFRNIFYS